MKILVLGGGTSPEREVSIRSAAAVQEALEQLGHHVTYVDPRDGHEAVAAAAAQCELVFPILHGAGGEDGSIQRLLEGTGKPYLGSGVAASELCFDKARLKDALNRQGVLTPKSALVDGEGFGVSELAKHPFVLKPNDGGSSVDMLLARTLPYNAERAQELLRKYGQMLLEELIDGIEITVPVLGHGALPVVEIVPPAGSEFDYENKYNGKTAEICPARSLSAAQQEQAQRIGEQVHAMAGARHLSRTDMIVTPHGAIYVLEINTMPGMTAQSLMPVSARAVGMSWTEFVNQLVHLATATTTAAK